MVQLMGMQETRAGTVRCRYFLDSLQPLKADDEGQT